MSKTSLFYEDLLVLSEIFPRNALNDVLGVLRINDGVYSLIVRIRIGYIYCGY